MIRAALFDFGGVILSSPFEAFATFEQERGLPTDFIRSVNATNPDTNAWALLERSDIGLEEFGTRFADESRALGHELHGGFVLDLLQGNLRPRMVEAVRRCSDRLLTGLLTNNFVLDRDADERDGAAHDHQVAHVDREQEMAEVVAMFDVVVESSKVGVRKPDPRFYELACTQLGIEPDEAVFLDDLGVNLKPARAMGMTTIKVVDPDDAIAQLETVVGFPLG